MHFPSAVEFLALAGVLAAVPVAVLAVSAARRRTGPARRAHLLLAGGGAAVTTAGVAAVLGYLALPGHGVHQGDRTRLGTFVALGLLLGVLALLGGTLVLPGLAGTAAAAGRNLLDGVVIAAAVWFVGWVLVSEPTRILGRHTPWGCLPLLLPLAAAALAFGLAAVVSQRASRPRRAPILVSGGVALVALAGTGIAAGICGGAPVLIAVGALAVPAALVVIGYGMRAAERSVPVEEDITRRGTAYAFLPMAAMVGAASYHLGRGGDFASTMAVATASVEGFALVARQYVALLDVRRYADRLREREAHFRELAHTDPLTGLANRRGLLRALHTEAFTGPSCVLLGLDLDGFKNVNDMRGHDVGDAVLIEVGQRLRMNLRPGDLAARLGGDEFAVLMWTRPTEARRAADRLLDVLNQPYEQPKGTVFLSASIGLAGTDTATDVAGLMRNADLALRYAKQRGKDRVERYDARYDELLRRRTTLEHELRGAIERDELHLVYQPVVALPSMGPVGAEALLRWHHPQLGAVPAGEFIPVAEECGMIGRLGEWVLHQACRQLSLWLAAGHDVWVSVNVSPRELHAPEYTARLAEVLRAHRVPPQRLVLEVTEHAVATDLAELIRRLKDLQDTGVRIALDDFGAGYSSLGQLRNLPVDILKIDHSLVADSAAGGAAAPLVDIVVRLGHRLGLEVIAEGMEFPGQLKPVEEAGCRFGQGSLFGWGVPAEHLEARLVAASSPGARPAPTEDGPAPAPTEDGPAPAPTEDGPVPAESRPTAADGKPAERVAAGDRPVPAQAPAADTSRSTCEIS